MVYANRRIVVPGWAFCLHSFHDDRLVIQGRKPSHFWLLDFLQGTSELQMLLKVIFELVTVQEWLIVNESLRHYLVCDGDPLNFTYTVLVVERLNDTKSRLATWDDRGKRSGTAVTIHTGERTQWTLRLERSLGLWVLRRNTKLPAFRDLYKFVEQEFVSVFNLCYFLCVLVLNGPSFFLHEFTKVFVRFFGF